MAKPFAIPFFACLIMGFSAKQVAAQTNTATGVEALQSNTTGVENTATGYRALWKNQLGSNNSAFGSRTLSMLTSGFGNTAVGQRALELATQGPNNTAIGTSAMGGYLGGPVGANTAVGAFALPNGGANAVALGYSTLGRGGQSTIAIGYETMQSGGGFHNIAIGHHAGLRMTERYNIAIGSVAMENSLGTENIALGVQAMESSPGNYNIAIGSQSQVTTQGSYNIGIGKGTLATTTASHLTAIGYEALFGNKSGTFNTAVGNTAMRFNTTGSNNSAFGDSAMYFNTVGGSNTAIGFHSLFRNTSGNSNTANGTSTMYNNTTGSQNTAYGVDALFENTSGSQNTANSVNALRANTTGSFNIATGNNSMFLNTTGLANNAYGYNSLFHNTTGEKNIAMGYVAGSGSNSSNSSFLGSETLATTDVNNSTALGYQAQVTASNQVRIGNTAVTSIGGQVEWTTLSDGRFKNNIKEDVPGLEFINTLRPVTYNLKIEELDTRLKGTNTKSANSVGGNQDQQLQRLAQPSSDETRAKAEKAKVKYTGFVAQEIEEAAKKMGYEFSGVDAPKGKDDLYGIRYSAFVVPLVKSVQELSKKNEELQEQIVELRDMVNKLMNGKTATNSTRINVSSAFLLPNAPNPFNATTVIKYHLPESSSNAKLIITNLKGQVLKTTTLNGKGDGQVTLQAGSLAAGTYTYTLLVNNEQVDSKQMIIAR